MEVLGIIIFILGIIGVLAVLSGIAFLAFNWLSNTLDEREQKRLQEKQRRLQELDRFAERARLARPHREKKITFIMPFRTDNGWREVVFQYLYEFYRFYFPDAEFIIPTNDDTPFCKTKAVNEGFKESHGDVIVMLDADCYIEPIVIELAVNKIREARKRGERLWFIPYRRFYRLTEKYTQFIMRTFKPFFAPILPDPPPASDYEPLTPGSVSAGHWYGALIQIFPSEAFQAVGGMDERFHGWGGEDVSFMHALDTLWSKHKTLDKPVYHFWHPSIKGRWKGTRMWEGQEKPEQNDRLSSMYEDAIGDRAAMRRLTTGEVEIHYGEVY